MEKQSSNQCPFCFPNKDNCKKSLLIILKLTKIIQKQVQKIPPFIALSSQQGFKQLIQYFSLELDQNQKAVLSCSHLNLKNYLIKKIGISLDDIYFLCQNIFDSLSKRKFDMELVEKIAKNTHQQVIKCAKKDKNVGKQKMKENQVKNENIIQKQFQAVQAFMCESSIENLDGCQIPCSSQKNQIATEQIQSQNRNPTNCSFFNYGNNLNNFSSLFVPYGYANPMYAYGFPGMEQNLQNPYYQQRKGPHIE